MKDYNLKDYENLKLLKEDLVKDFNNDFADVELTSKTYTDCEILEAEYSTEVDRIGEKPRQDIAVSISCNKGIINVCIRSAVINGLFTLPKDKKDLFDEYFTKLDKAVEDRDAELEEMLKESIARSEKEKIAREARKAAYEAKQAELKAKEKLAKRITKSQEKLAHDLKTAVKIDSDPVDWLKNNTVSIIATVPTHLEKVFKSQFPDAEYNLVDSNRKTSGGYSMKWNCSFCLTTKKDAVIPAELSTYFKGNKINNTSLIATLVRNYDFKFSKTR